MRDKDVLAEEVRALEADEEDRTEMLEIATVMESVRPLGWRLTAAHKES
jgi:hypothetical protein